MEADGGHTVARDAAVAGVGLVEVSRVRAADVDLRVRGIARVVRDRDLLRPAGVADGGVREAGPGLIGENEAVGDARPAEGEAFAARRLVDVEAARVVDCRSRAVADVHSAVLADAECGARAVVSG